ncbi:MAG: DUF438 domain-containing protein [Porphyromonadaceae bacterium]|jgi:DUF438 domain-containing protein|nr:DUF438 domain-containing protein [Porphyromonadaceae bacterium]
MNNKKDLLKHMLLQLHEGAPAEVLRNRIVETMSSIPYHEVVEVEQELISDGVLSPEEILAFCDLHTAVLEGSIDLEDAKSIPEGHPVDTFKKENIAIQKEADKLHVLFNKVKEITDENVADYIIKIRTVFNTLWDIDKHYKRKEYLLFPYLEQHGITGPPKIMWGKHDEIRALLKDVYETLDTPNIEAAEMVPIVDLVLKPVIELIEGMIMKEEEILLPMSMDTLTEEEWYKVYQETPEFGFCLVDPEIEWKPEGIVKEEVAFVPGDAIRLSSGNFNLEELESLFVNLPIDITYVDKDDKVRFFSHSPNRVFERNRSVLGRDVRLCHPPGSVHIVEQILNDFKSGKENKAVFWMSNFQGRFIYIDYTALRDKEGNYLGVVEFTQDITELRKLEGDQRLLSYD